MILRKLEKATDLQTGDILHAQNLFSPVSTGIAIGTSPWRYFTGRSVPTHTAMVVRQGGKIQVYESDYGEGVHSDEFHRWLKGKQGFGKRVWYTPIDATGYRYDLGQVARAMEGLDYERVIEMFGIPFDLNDNDEKKVFCTEFVYRCYLHVDEAKWKSDKIDGPDNISPASFAFNVLNDWPKREI